MSDEPSGPVTVRGVLAGFRPWDPLVRRHTHFEWLTGLRVAIAFVLPAGIGYFSGRAPLQWAMIAFGGFLASVVASQIPSTRELCLAAPAIVLSIPVAIALGMVAGGWARVPMIAAVGLALGIAFSGSPRTRRAASCLGIAIVLAPELPSTAVAMRWTFVGGVWAIALLLATQPLLALTAPSTAPRPTAVSRMVAVHHGVRLAVALAIAAVIAEVAGSSTPIREHALWASVGVWIVLQPHLHDTLTRGIQRAVGTLLGGLLTLVLVQIWPASVWTGWLVLACAFVCFGIRSANYSWYCVVLTPVVVLGIGHITTDLDVLEARVGWTILGTLIALAVRFALWPVAAHRPSGGTAPDL